MCNCSGRPQAQLGPSYIISGTRDNPPPEATLSRDYKLLLDEVFVISRKIKVEVGVISRSQRLRLISINSTFMILDIIKTSSNNCFITKWTKKKWTPCLCLFTDGKQHKARELGIITLRNHAPRSYMTWLPVTLSVLEWSLTWLLYNLHLLLVSLAHSIAVGAAELIFTSVIRTSNLVPRVSLWPRPQERGGVRERPWERGWRTSGLNRKCRDYVTLATPRVVPVRSKRLSEAEKLSHLLGLPYLPRRENAHIRVVSPPDMGSRSSCRRLVKFCKEIC